MSQQGSGSGVGASGGGRGGRGGGHGGIGGGCGSIGGGCGSIGGWRGSGDLGSGGRDRSKSGDWSVSGDRSVSGGGDRGGGDHSGANVYFHSLSWIHGSSHGQPPMFGRAMTPAKKMRRSSERKCEAMGEVEEVNAQYHIIF